MTERSRPMKVLVIDNYDSFTYNLVQYLGELGAEVEVVRNDRATVDELLDAAATSAASSRRARARPNEAGISLEAVRRLPEAGIPTLGVCLGHQAIAQAFGGAVVRTRRCTARRRRIEHDGRTIFARARRAAHGRALPLAGRRRRAARLPGGAARGGGVVMGVRHRELPVEGVQFHPESVLTEQGQELLAQLPRRPASDVRSRRPVDAQSDPHAARSTRSPRADGPERGARPRRCSPRSWAARSRETQIAGFLIALRTKGETVEELAGLARTMRELAAHVPVDARRPARHRRHRRRAQHFNVSTTAALVAAGAGCAVAKHGNRSATSRSGSADVLEALGARIDLAPAAVARCIEEVGFGFMFAPAHHQATRFVVPGAPRAGGAHDLQLPRAR